MVHACAIAFLLSHLRHGVPAKRCETEVARGDFVNRKERRKAQAGRRRRAQIGTL
jgi:hypothetical protein